jgi:UDP-N-acetyl-2-amino-2-deoxyglucuronate dehydrogenase
VIYTVLQLRLHPALVAFRERLRAQPDKRHAVELAYLTARGRWYDVSWKGVDERSGGIVTNIGIHFFDLLQWLFGAVQESEVHLREPRRAAGYFRLERARVRWLLSAEWTDVPDEARQKGRSTFRSITVDGREVEFSEGFADLHTRVYEETLAGRGFGIDDSRPAIELTHRLRQAPITSGELCHPLLSRLTR